MELFGIAVVLPGLGFLAMSAKKIRHKKDKMHCGCCQAAEHENTKPGCGC